MGLGWMAAKLFDHTASPCKAQLKSGKPEKPAKILTPLLIVGAMPVLWQHEARAHMPIGALRSRLGSATPADAQAKDLADWLAPVI